MFVGVQHDRYNDFWSEPNHPGIHHSYRCPPEVMIREGLGPSNRLNHAGQRQPRAVESAEWRVSRK